MITMPWYDRWEHMFAKSEPLLNLILIGIIVITLLLLLFGNVWTKAVWAVYLLSP